MADLKIEIDELCRHPANSRKTLVRNTIPFNENVTFPFEKIISVFKTLYSNKQLIFNFTIF